MTSLQPRTPIFPEHPEDGFVVIEYLDDGRELHWTYNKTLNQWAAHFVYPESPATEGWVQGQGYVKGPVRTKDVLTTDPTVKDESVIKTQEQVNNVIAGVAEYAVKAGARTTDQVDFLQNSVGKGVWSHMDGVLGPDEYPGFAQFWADNTEFKKVTQFKFNDTGVPGVTNPGSLQDTRVGDYLTVQCNDKNDFGQYVIYGMATENIDDNIVRTFDVKLYRNARAVGELSPLANCTVTTFRPASVIVQDEQPVVSSRGILWYREKDDHLFISNYADGFTGEGPQWTDLTAGGGGDYLPLTGGTIDGMVTINNGPLLVNSAQVVELPTGGDLFTVLGADNGEAILAINGAGSGKYLGRQTVDENIATLGYVGDNYLPLAGGNLTGTLEIKRDSGTSLIVRKGDSLKFDVQAGGKIRCFYDLSLDDDDTTVVTRGFVKEQLASVGGGELSLKDKMYLQGFYPWRFAEGTNPNEGEWVAKTYDYNVVLDPASWKMLYFSTVDAYGQDLAGKFLNHMDFNNYRELQMWFAREDGTKICSYIGKMKCRDQNFEERFTVDMDASDKELLTSPKWDTVSLEISRGETLWIKCSAWGN